MGAYNSGGLKVCVRSAWAPVCVCVCVCVFLFFFFFFFGGGGGEGWDSEVAVCGVFHKSIKNKTQKATKKIKGKRSKTN